ncbi:hypothetical protein [Enterovirga aerilata]|uniref:Uncharacterized protein n=1 Tax=Enterovirga aerilata TaxID=2730920 RepID=A0A849IFL0_9HYPH|nr:hypothetical protein [Enterovirga sp. DB1703]NNM74930.1 hypothetical protein [Enterovirga sp. DB1703]
MQSTVIEARPSGAATPLLERRWLLVAVALLGLAIFLRGQSGIMEVARRLLLPDSDDAMRLVAVRDLLAGQGWFDNVQHRYLPPAGVAMHWSRLVDAPLAAAILALTPFLGATRAEGLVAAFWPPLLFLAYLGLIFRGTGRLFGFRAACFAIFVACELALTALFAPGRVDHHNIQALTMTFVVLQLAGPERSWRKGAAAGLGAAFSLAVGLETLPFVAALGVGLVLHTLAERGPGRDLAAFGAALAAGSCAFFALQTSPALWTSPECDSLSPPWLLLAGGGGIGAVAVAASARSPSAAARLGLAVAIGAALLLAFARLFPHCLAGPFVGLPEEARADWLGEVLEAASLAHILALSPAAGLGVVVPMAAAFAAALVGLRRAEPHLRPAFFILALFTGTGLAITAFQLRGFYVGSALVPVIGGWAFDRAISAVTRPGTDGRIGAGPIAMLAAATLLLTHTATATADLLQGLLGRPSAGAVPMVRVGDCAKPETLRQLDAAPPGLVLAPVDLGPSLLLFTRHSVIAAPYHRQGEGIVAGLAVAGGSQVDVERAVRRFRPRYLLACADWAKPGSFAERLAQDEAPSPGLRLAARIGRLRLWEIGPDAFRAGP